MLAKLASNRRIVVSSFKRISTTCLVRSITNVVGIQHVYIQ